MLSYHLALEQVRQTVSPLASERVALTDALGRTLAADLLAPHPMPPFDQSLMDGYAARSRDTRTATAAQPVRLPLGSTLTAGETLQQPVPPRQAIRIMTGAPMPPGVDAVVRLEDAVIEDNILVIGQPLRRGQFIQRRGAEVKPLAVVCKVGERLTPQRIGMALALGLAEAEVVRPPRVAFVAPGDELLPPGASLQAGKKWCSNLYALDARARELGYESRNLGIVPDTAEALTAALQQGLAGDAVVILGASGQGVHDYAGRAMADVGASLMFRGVAIVPGRSTAVARHRQTLIFGLPGSPWAAFITFEMLVRPALDALLGQPAKLPLPAVLASDVSMRRGATHFVPVRLQPSQPDPEAVPLRDLLAVARAEAGALGMLMTPSNRRHLPPGSRVRILPL
ncbi:molybdopterin molybdotransferase MoeA [Candidatus Entotheonella palauensis]|uniref:molybdopterin molybdotransferase MoeA n=1 Tax=Candidatus Entotheonella palauensis TaxID=93172 RepID=UPI000B7DC6EB|nr:gephyrin-like molybdotransferase Glp [Candidatus Entotheonella palauensis]